MQKIGTDELETLYKEGDEHGVRKTLRSQIRNANENSLLMTGLQVR